jgi:acetyl-CoA acetyltransferase
MAAFIRTGSGMSLYGEKTVAISGVGQSSISRGADKSPLELTLDACLAAIADAGLTPDDIDGCFTWPGRVENDPGFGPVSVSDVKEALSLKLGIYAGGMEAPGQLGSSFSAIAAIAAGFAKHVIVFRSVYEATTRLATKGTNPLGNTRVEDARFQWQLPFGAYSAANWCALYAQRHMFEFGTTETQFAQIALNARRNAERNPKAIYRTPLDMQTYLASRMISTPLRLFDCDVPVDAATAVVYSRLDLARDLRNKPIRVEAIGSALHGRDSWDQRSDITTMAAHDAAAMMWSRTDLKPADIGCAQLYDGFSILTMLWLEALGFCGHGESGAFIEGGNRIALDGVLPLNTSGGQLSEGRTHGYGYVHEACLQMRGLGVERQIAERPNCAVIGVGGGPLGGCMLLVAD